MKLCMKYSRINLRTKPGGVELLKKVCDARGEGLDFVRRAIRKELARLGFLDGDGKQALEVYDL